MGPIAHTRYDAASGRALTARPNLVMQLPNSDYETGTWLPAMSSALRRPQTRTPRPSASARSPWHRGVVALGVGVPLVLVAAVPAVLAVWWFARSAGATVSELDPLPSRLDASPERSVVVDRDGRHLATLKEQNRISTPLEDIPDDVVNAVVATEDHTFWQHGGVNWEAILRAAFRNASAGEITGGGSTITQQLVKNRLVGTEQSLHRKISEAVYARQLEQRSSKREILELYLNDTYFGNGVYGIATAAEYYWSKPVEALTLAEGATLAGMIRSPENNDPIDHPDRALARRAIVLEQMVELDMVDPAVARAAAERPLALDVQPPERRESPFLVDVIERELAKQPALGDTPDERLAYVRRAGLRIKTTFDERLQRIAERTIRDTLTDKRRDPLASIVAVEPGTGEMLAVAVGPKDYGTGPGQTTLNPAVPELSGTGRQPGSTFKAFELVAALESDVPVTHTFHSAAEYTSDACPGYTVENYGGADLGVQDMRIATATSSNTYFVHLLELSGGPETLVDVAQRMGIESDIEPHCSLVLGAEEVYPVEMASAFGTLAAEGVHCARHAIRAVLDRDGDPIHRAEPDCEQVVDPEVAAQATDLLRAPVDQGTASAHGQIGRPAAGKTGTTTGNENAWFTGYVPQMAVATWVGHELPEKLEHPLCGEVTGGCLPTMLWHDFMVESVNAMDLAVEQFPAPPPPPPVVVPNVVGLPEAEAAQRLLDVGFVPQTTVVPDDSPAGTVVGQAPGAGQAVQAGSSVGLSVSDGLGLPEPAPPPETSSATVGEPDDRRAPPPADDRPPYGPGAQGRGPDRDPPGGPPTRGDR